MELKILLLLVIVLICLIHELLHTVPNGHDHRGEWKKWAKYVSVS